MRAPALREGKTRVGGGRLAVGIVSHDTQIPLWLAANEYCTPHWLPSFAARARRGAAVALWRSDKLTSKCPAPGSAPARSPPAHPARPGCDPGYAHQPASAPDPPIDCAPWPRAGPETARPPA